MGNVKSGQEMAAEVTGLMSQHQDLLESDLVALERGEELRASRKELEYRLDQLILRKRWELDRLENLMSRLYNNKLR